MFTLQDFVQDKILQRRQSLFIDDINEHAKDIANALKNKSVCVIGGAGTIGTAFIKEMLKRGDVRSLVVIDISENALTELTRDLRSSVCLSMPKEYRPYALNYADPIFTRIFEEEKGFDIVANFAAHKHVRSEYDKYAVQALIENNDLKTMQLMELLSKYPPKHFFCVSTDKAANPVNVMGASKRIMEDLVMAYSDRFKVTTARFANVAFSNGSLPDSWLRRLEKRQPLAAPADVKRYFVSMEEAGQICLIACLLGQSGEIFFPKLKQTQMMQFHKICDEFLYAHDLDKLACDNDAMAAREAANLKTGDRMYPTVYFRSMTTGEKLVEEFYEEGEPLDMERYSSLGVILPEKHCNIEEISDFFARLKTLFAGDFTKAEVVEQIKSFIPTFSHTEKKTNLNDRL